MKVTDNRGTKNATAAKVKLYWVAQKSEVKLPSISWQTKGITVNNVATNLQNIDVPAHASGWDGKASTTVYKVTIPKKDI